MSNLNLYEMIWQRTLSCQMTPAIFDAVSVDLEIGKGESIFRASGQTLKVSRIYVSLYGR